MARKKDDGTLKGPQVGQWNSARMTPQKAKVKTGGNAICDRDWIKAEWDSIMELESKPDNVPWDVEWQWDGYADEVDPDWFESYRRSPRHCTGIAYIRDPRGGYIIDLEGIRLQRPCLASPIHGAAVCQKHGGQLPDVKKQAMTKLGMAAEKAADTLITLTDAKDENDVPVEHGTRLKAANSVLDRVGIRAGAEVEVTVPGYQKVVEDMFGEEPADAPDA